MTQITIKDGEFVDVTFSTKRTDGINDYEQEIDLKVKNGKFFIDLHGAEVEVKE